MDTKKLLRLISIVMLIAAVIFVYCAVSCPTLGSVFYIGSVRIDAEIKSAFYGFYVIVMALLFISSFFIKKKK